MSSTTIVFCRLTERFAGFVGAAGVVCLLSLMFFVPFNETSGKAEEQGRSPARPTAKPKAEAKAVAKARQPDKAVAKQVPRQRPSGPKGGGEVEVLADKKTLDRQKQSQATSPDHAAAREEEHAADTTGEEKPEAGPEPQAQAKASSSLGTGAYGLPHLRPPCCAVEGCQAMPFKAGLCQGHYTLHFYDLAEGGRLWKGPNLPVDKCVVKDCGGDVFKLGYCREHYAQNERDLVDSIDLELAGLKNPYNMEHKENVYVTNAKQRRRAEQEHKDAQAKEALKQALLDRLAFEKARKEREVREATGLRPEDAQREAQKKREAEAAERAAQERRKKEQEDGEERARRERERAEREEQASKEARRREEDAAAQARQALAQEQDEELRRLREQREHELELLRRGYEEELAKLKQDREAEQERLRREREAAQEALRAESMEMDERRREEENQWRKEERARRKEEERLKKEMEIRAATRAIFAEQKAVSAKIKSDMTKDHAGEQMVRDVDEHGRPKFSSNTTYAEAHQKWERERGFEAAEEGVLGVSGDGMVFRSSNYFGQWTLLSHLELESDPDSVLLDCMLRTSGGRYYAVTGGRLLSLDPLTGKVRFIAQLKGSDGAAITRVAAACRSQWLHQKHVEQAFVVVSKGVFEGVAGDSICRLDLRTGQCDMVMSLRRTDISAIASPPLLGGPWHGVVFFLWSRSGGLTCVHWANEGYTERCLGASPGQAEDVRALAFSSAGTFLYSVGDAIDVLDPQTGARAVAELPTPASFVAAVWDKDLPPAPVSLLTPIPSPAISPVPSDAMVDIFTTGLGREETKEQQSGGGRGSGAAVESGGAGVVRSSPQRPTGKQSRPPSGGVKKEGTRASKPAGA